MTYSIRGAWPGVVVLTILCGQTAPVAAQTTDPMRPAPAAVTAAAPARTEARMALQMESLSNNSADWQDASFEITSDAGPRQRWFAAFHDVRRFSLHDDLFAGGYLHPIGKNALVTIEAQGSLSHQVVPQFSLAGRIDAAVGRGWVLNGGLSERRYDTGDVTMVTAGIEKYLGAFRFAYTSFGAFLGGQGSLSHSAGIDRTYGRGEDNIVGITLAGGEELEHDGTGLRTSEVRGISARGRHWLGRRVGLLYTIGIHEQGTYYTRRGGTAGIAFRF